MVSLPQIRMTRSTKRLLCYSMDTSWGISDFYHAVNLHRTKGGCPPIRILIHIQPLCHTMYNFILPGHKRDTPDLLLAFINVSKYMIYPDISPHSLIYPPENAGSLGLFPKVNPVSVATTIAPYNIWMETHHLSIVCELRGQLGV